MTAGPLQSAIAQVPPGRWAVGVSGGADSVAMLGLLRERADLQLVVVHLDHETRGQASTDDASFVASLAAGWKMPAVIARRSEIQPGLADPPANASALYRACRLALFRKVVAERQLQGVILAHHADDLAETVLHRLLRGGAATGLAGMAASGTVGGLLILRPMLAVRREMLRQTLTEQGQPFREDASNASDDYLRNRLRKILLRFPDLVPELLALSKSTAALRDWVLENAPKLEARFRVERICDIPPVLARESARRWLVSQGAPASELSTKVLDRLVLLCTDASTPPRGQFPCRIMVGRKGGWVERLDGISQSAG